MSTDITVVAIIAPAGSGKTTAARFLQREYGFVPISFAGPIKRVARDVLGFTDQQLAGPNEIKERVDPRYGISPRTFLQRLGIAMREHVGPDIWIRGVIREIETAGPGRYVIDDCRFPNELAALREMHESGAIHLACIGIDCRRRDTTDDGSHETERHIRGMLESVPMVVNEMNGIAAFEEVIRLAVTAELVTTAGRK